MPFSRGSTLLRNQICVFHLTCIGRLVENKHLAVFGQCQGTNSLFWKVWNNNVFELQKEDTEMRVCMKLVYFGDGFKKQEWGSGKSETEAWEKPTKGTLLRKQGLWDMNRYASQVEEQGHLSTGSHILLYNLQIVFRVSSLLFLWTILELCWGLGEKPEEKQMPKGCLGIEGGQLPCAQGCPTVVDEIRDELGMW